MRPLLRSSTVAALSFALVATAACVQPDVEARGRAASEQEVLRVATSPVTVAERWSSTR